MPNRLFRFPTLGENQYHYVVADLPHHAALLLGRVQANDNGYNATWYQQTYLGRGHAELGKTAAMPGVVALYQGDMGRWF